MRLHKTLIILICIAFVAPVQAETKRVTVAAYNLLNLMDVFDDPYTDDESTRVKPHDETRAAANAIKALGADVVAVTELENEGVLRAVAHEFLAAENYRYIHAGQTNDGRGVRCGILSRYPIVKTCSYRFRELTLPDETRTWLFARDLTQVTLQVTDTQEMDVFIIHFKSRRDSRDDPMSAKWRLAEASEVHKRITDILERDPDHWVVLLGDFNDTPETKTLALLAGEDAPLRDMHAKLPESKRITYLHEPYRSTIDYILASPGLAKHAVPDSAIVLDQAHLLGGSDHAPLAVSFELPQ